jgi:hypothetical protein
MPKMKMSGGVRRLYFLPLKQKNRKKCVKEEVYRIAPKSMALPVRALPRRDWHTEFES